ncbi:Saccharopine dehydrogenase Homospermidine synthase [Fusarium coicis]|nr:Saccharopine dehydrogenase Homospermidine synthase [Fusarium coicis]
MNTRTHEITILGATGWTATICAEHIAKTFPTNTRWCIAGRSALKLEALRQDLRAINPDGLEPTIYIIPQLNAEGLEPIVRETKVLINGIGPYHRHGTPVVDACARNGTHYIDFSTETAWHAGMIQNFHETAKGSGAIIIPAISGSSAPSDLVAWLIARHLREQDLPAASEIHVVKKNKEPMGHRYDRYLGHLATSFVAWGNESVVQRSAALDPKIYGQDFVYKEYIPAGGLISALLMHIVTKLGIFLLAVPWFRSFIRGKSFNRGSGPDRDESRKIESAEWKAVGYVTGEKDPVALAKFSYKGALVDMAAILAVEAAATINQMNKTEATSAGLLTPSTLGIAFVDRLRAAGFDLMVEGSLGCRIGGEKRLLVPTTMVMRWPRKWRALKMADTAWKRF